MPKKTSVLVPDAAQNIKFETRARELFTIAFSIRVLFTLLIAPTSYLLWNRKDGAPNVTLGLVNF
jgi:hypothetical protein